MKAKPPKRMPTLRMQFQTERDIDPRPPERPTGASRSNGSRRRSSSSQTGGNRTPQVRGEVGREFLRTTTKGGTQDEVYTNPESLPSIDMAYNAFQRTYPKFSETWSVDELRDREYFHLEESQQVCMDYCGFGLFSYYQQIINKATSSFGLAYISANLPTHALYGAADEGTVEFYIRKRVMDYLNINDAEYSMVFTASRGTAFKLLGESYPFHPNSKLLTVYDFESEAVNWMAGCARQRGAKIMSACFKWPSLRIGTSHLKKLLQEKKKKSDSAKGLFVFPVQSRMTGSKYSYQWMSEAQQNKWHVLLDASSLGPKDMDSLGLSLFRPDFIVSSFYKVFGTDPTGFGCLFIKNTAIHSLQNSSRARAVGMVRIVSLSNFTSEGPEGNKETEDDEGSEVQLRKRRGGLERLNNNDEDPLSSFSGPYFAAVEPDLKLKHPVKESNHLGWKSWKRSGKMASPNDREFVGSNGLSGIGGGGGGIKFKSQPTKTRLYSEATRASEIEEVRPSGSRGEQHPRHRLYFDRSEKNEIEELEDDDEGSRRFSNAQQWRSQGRGGTGNVQKEYEPIEFQSLGGKGISPIREVDGEDLEVEQERWESGQCSKSSDTANGSGGAHMVLSDGRRDGGANEIDEDPIDVERNDLGQFDDEVEDVGRTKWDLSPIEEMPESSQSARRRGHAANEGSEDEDEEESSDVVPIGELPDDSVKRNVLSRTMSEPGGQNSVQARLNSFERRASFKRHTGKQLSDFQEMGVDGLVQKFRTLGSGKVFQEDFEGADDDIRVEGSGPVRTASYFRPGDSPRAPGASSETAPHSLPAGDGNFKQNVDSKGKATEGDGNFREEGGPSFMDPLKEEGSLVDDEAEGSEDLNIDHMPTRDHTAVHRRQHSSLFSDHGRTPSGEVNSIAIQPSRIIKKSSKRVPEAVIETRARGSQELSDKATSSALGRENLPENDDSSSPENRFRIEHAGGEERLFKSSRRSPSMKLGGSLPSTPSKERGGTDDPSFDTAKFHDTRDQGLENGRSDLRSNRTLSRNVDFEDDMYPGRRSYASEMFDSRRQPMGFAEDAASLDMQDSDEESYQSQYYSGSLYGSRYMDDDLEPASYREGEEGDTDEDEYEDLQKVELQQEDEEEPIISCKGLDYADKLGLTKLNYRLRFLINWLVNSLLKLRHPGPNQGIPLVRIYGPKVKYDRGAAVSFNMFDWKGLLIQPGVVQRLADRCNISLGVGKLCNVVDPEMSPSFMAEKERLPGMKETAKGSPHARKLGAGKSGGTGDAITIPVLTAAMGFVTNFEDVYKLWSFLAKFLDADYMSKEVWRYHSLNQEIMVM